MALVKINQGTQLVSLVKRKYIPFTKKLTRLQNFGFALGPDFNGSNKAENNYTIYLYR
jgi:hypothetical protein